MSESFKIRDILAERGSKAFGFLNIQDDAAGTVKIPLCIINGSEKGPIISITGGLFGTQYPGIDACIRLNRELNPKELNGTVMTVPVAEVTSFQKCMDKSPIDGKSLNSVFPGDPKGTITEREAHVLFNEVILKSNYHLDLRGGDLWETIQTFSMCCLTGNREFDATTEDLTKVLGTRRYMVTQRDRKGALMNETCRVGVPSIILEASKGLARYDEDDIQACMKGIYNLLKYLNMIEGEPEIPDNIKKLEYPMHHIKAKSGGLLYLQISEGQTVSNGQKLGEIINLKGETIQELNSPVEGVIHLTFPKHIKQPGETILGIRRIIN